MTHVVSPVTTAEASALAAKYFGLAGSATPLAGEMDANFCFTTDAGAQFVLKLMHPSRESTFVELQAATLEHLRLHAPELRVPRVHRTTEGGAAVSAVLADGSTRLLWMVDWMAGVPLAEVRPRHGAVLAELGRALGALDAALLTFAHPAAERELRWDLTRSAWILEHLHHIRDPHRRALVERVLDAFMETVLPALPGLRRSVIHGDVNDYNVMVETPHAKAPRHPAIIDFGDMHVGPVVCDLAIAATYALADADDPVAAASAVIAGYHAILPLSDDEIALLFPLICTRLAVSVVNSAWRATLLPDDPYVTISERGAWEALERLMALPPRLAHYAFRGACGLEPSPTASHVVAWLAGQSAVASPVLDQDPLTVPHIQLDLSSGSLMLGADPASVSTDALFDRISATMQEAGVELAIGRYEEPRPIYTSSLFRVAESPLAERRTLHMGLDLFVDPGMGVRAPLAGTVHAVAINPGHLDYGGVVVLRHETDAGVPFFTLYGHLSHDSVRGHTISDQVDRGHSIGAIGTEEENGRWPPHLHFQVITDLLELGTDFPGVVRASERVLWRSLSPDPAPLLGLDASDAWSAGELLPRREGVIGSSVRLSYDEPITMVRGWQQYLFDETGRAYLDVFNNVPLVGHGHPRVVRAVQEQMALLNTNTRYLHENLVRYAEALTARMPDPLTVCVVVNSASEANELALRMARAATGRKDLIVLDHAYHGHTTTLIDISPYKFNGPGGAGRQPWVHVAPIPDEYRGAFRRDDPARATRYAAAVRELLVTAEASGAPIGAFIAESLPSVGGQVVLPPGYLAEVYRHVRAAGGVCIADEVQVGFGRLGSHFWGFATQDAVPDIVVLGKPIGNGFPLAAVVTTRAIADAFDTGMEYFSTFGGNPVASAAGLAVLDVLDREDLMGNAARVGERLKQRLEHLMNRHALIGDVRGMGLFLGVELVRDRLTLEPAAAEASYVVNRLRDRGILCGTDGPHHNVLKIRPPLCFSDEDAALFVATLDEILGEDAVR